MWTNGTLGRGLFALAIFALAAVAAPRMPASGAGASTASITIKAGQSIASIPSTAFGMNTATWDPYLLDGGVPHLLKQAGVTVLRFPGGISADAFHWKQQTLTEGSNVRSSLSVGVVKVSFDAYMGVVKKIGGQALLTVNYGTNASGNGPGDPNDAAAWVKYANVTKHDGVKYWEIGNEVYGNGFYQLAWESDLHSDKSPTAYGNNAAAFIQAMKAVDSSIKVGVVLVAPGYFPDGQTPDWNSNVLSAVGSKIDFVIVHFYAEKRGQLSDAGLLDSTAQIPGMVSKLRAEIKQYCGANAKNVQIFVTETNSSGPPAGKQMVGPVNGLFLADDYMTWLENGAANVDWWDLHLPMSVLGDNSSSLYGASSYGDFGILSSGACKGGICEPPVDTPFPPYYALEMVARLGKAGDAMVTASSSRSVIAVHAVKQAKGNLAVLLINKDRTNSYHVSLTLNKYTPTAKATVYTYGPNSSSIASSTTGSSHKGFAITVAPYTLTVIVMTPQPHKCQGKGCTAPKHT